MMYEIQNDSDVCRWIFKKHNPGMWLNGENLSCKLISVPDQMSCCPSRAKEVVGTNNRARAPSRSGRLC